VGEGAHDFAIVDFAGRTRDLGGSGDQYSLTGILSRSNLQTVAHDKSQDQIRLTAALRNLPTEAQPAFKGWPNAPLNVLDCVLSLNRRYETFCLPRVQRFADHRPEIGELSALRSLILTYPTPLKFSEVELNYRDERRASVLLGVTEYLLSALEAFSATNGALFGPDGEMARLGAWARSVTPNDAWSTGVRGFALAGFQYLRMLFGVQTAKPDVHIIHFVSDAVGRKVNEIEALVLLEEVAQQENLQLADLDYSIWLESSGATYEKTSAPNR
jgi:hypothetical protein